MQYLVSYPRVAASRETLADAFWPGEQTESVAHRLHLAVSGARAALREALPSIDGINCVCGSYRWHPELRIEADCEAFFACYREGTIDSMKRGISLYGGPFLAGETAEWMYALRVRASSAYMTMLERLAEDAFGRNDAATAVEYGMQVVEADRGHEGATRLVMRSFAALGRRSAAIAEYEALERYLRRHLRVSPSRSTVAVREEIVAG